MSFLSSSDDLTSLNTFEKAGLFARNRKQLGTQDWEVPPGLNEPWPPALARNH